MKKRCIAILLAAGVGKRMESTVAKQYMQLCGKPVIWYGLQAFEKSALIDKVVLVVGKGEVEYAQAKIIAEYGFKKVSAVVEGGAERFLSVNNALQTIASKGFAGGEKDTYIFIHDGARPLITEQILERTYEAAVAYGACCAAVKVKDTIKIVDEAGFAIQTPKRDMLYSMQTPQVFAAPIIMEAYERLMESLVELEKAGITITDDAMVVEQMLKHSIKMAEGDYKNIKITTPEDMDVAECFLKHKMAEF